MDAKWAGFGLALSMALGLFLQSAKAADLKPIYKAARPPDPVRSWTGLYVGANAGYGSAHQTAALVDGNSGPEYASGQLPSSVPIKGTGYLIGAQAGYNYQLGSWVLGGEGDIQYSTLRLHGSVTGPNTDEFSGGSLQQAEQKLDWLGTLRARAGYLIQPEVLIYGTGGLAVGKVATSSSVNALDAFGGEVARSSITTTKTGFAYGGGAEWAFATNWSVKLEYLRYDLGSSTFKVFNTFAGHSANSYFGIANIRDTGQIARVGLNYRL